jgi:hypothetical protein
MNPELIYQLMEDAGYQSPHLSNKAHQLVKLLMQHTLSIPKPVSRAPKRDEKFWVLFSYEGTPSIWYDEPEQINQLKRARVYLSEEDRDTAELYISNILK